VGQLPAFQTEIQIRTRAVPPNRPGTEQPHSLKMRMTQEHVKQTLLQTDHQCLIAKKVDIHDPPGNRISRHAIMGVISEITILNHQHPGLTVLNQAEAERLTHSVTRILQGSIALAAQQISQCVSAKIEGVLKNFDQPLLLALIERRRLQKTLKLFQSPAVVAEALLPANVTCHAPKLDAQERQGRDLAKPFSGCT
jgi:hypothetical protein